MNADHPSWPSPDSETDEFEARLSGLRPMPTGGGAAEMLLAAGYAQGQRDQTRTGHGAQRWLPVAACVCVVAGFGGYQLGHENAMSQVAEQSEDAIPAVPEAIEEPVVEADIEMIVNVDEPENDAADSVPHSGDRFGVVFAMRNPPMPLRLRVRTVDFDWESYARASSAFRARRGRGFVTREQLTPRSELRAEQLY